jgi:hypothetical protein
MPAKPTPPAAAETPAPLAWEADLRLLTSPPMLRQFGTVVGLSGLIMALLLAFLMAVQGDWDQIGMMVLISAGAALFLGLLMALVALLFFGNRIRLRHTLDAKGALTETVDRRARAGNRLAILAGLLGGSATATGAGMIGLSRESERVSWRGIAEARYHPASRTIALRNQWRTVALLACTADNFDEVAAYVAQRVAAGTRTNQGRQAESPASASPVPRLLGRTALVVLACLPVFVLPYPFELDLLLPLILLCFALATVWLVPLFGWVVMAVAAALVIQIVAIGLETKTSQFASVGTYRNLDMVDGAEALALLLAAAGLAYLVITAWRAVRGRATSALGADAEEMEEG